MGLCVPIRKYKEQEGSFFYEIFSFNSLNVEIYMKIDPIENSVSYSRDPDFAKIETKIDLRTKNAAETSIPGIDYIISSKSLTQAMNAIDENRFPESIDYIQGQMTPHMYPLWIQIGAIFTIILAFIHFSDLPYYYKINDKIKEADAAFQKKNYRKAGVQFLELALLLPGNKDIKLCIAKCFFQSSEEKDRLIALRYLKGFSFSKNEWDDLLNYMPKQYVGLFATKEGIQS